MPVMSEELTRTSNTATALVSEKQDPLMRMQEELRRAMQKPIEQRRWVMVIDLRKCIGCPACTIGCVVENKLPPGVVYRPVMDEEIGVYPNVTRRFLPRPCMQCDNPPCVPVCPVNATYKRPDGIIAINYEECIGCRYCIVACPYSARTFDAGRHYLDSVNVSMPALLGQQKAMTYEKLPAYEYGETWNRAEGDSPIGNARKCQFCSHRLNAGMLPMCATTCIGRATYFGDANDPDALVSELIASPNVMRLKEEMGTEPKVYYLT
jgi:molybdopterin-containing oxidoreductase family iron-sulfur binding subunit